MAEYIEREEAKQFFNLNFGGVSHAIIASRLLDEIPAADVSPVRHGRWLYVDTDIEQFFLCNRCKQKEYWESDYCPNCGAKMDLEAQV